MPAMIIGGDFFAQGFRFRMPESGEKPTPSAQPSTLKRGNSQ